MRKRKYYIRLSTGALKRVKGYVLASVGVHRIGRQWYATHLPTGCYFGYCGERPDTLLARAVMAADKEPFFIRALVYVGDGKGKYIEENGALMQEMRG